MSNLRSRLNKILDLHGKALAEAVNLGETNSQETQLPAKDLILRFAGSDPTPGKSRTQWLVKTYIKDKHFKLEDLGRVYAALAAFERFKRKLPLEQREINHLKTLSSLETLINPFVKAEAKARLERDLSTATGRELRRLECVKARDESIVVQECEGVPTIAVPMTEFAACWWGRGTQWCTAADKNNSFAHYHEFAPLLVIICPDGAKFQMNVKSYTFQFMDSTDKDVSEQIIEERWSEFQSLFYWAVRQNRMALEYLSEDKRHPELCRLAVKRDGTALEYVPEHKRNPELCRIAVEQHGWALRFVPEEYRTSELCRLAVEQNGEALEYVPKQYITPELCRLAVKRDGMTLDSVPKNKRTPELCRLAIEQDSQALQFVPEKHKTYELCLIAIEQDGIALEYTPFKLISSRADALQEGSSFANKSHGGEDNKTPEFYQLAIEQNGIALQFVPENKRTLELCLLAIEQNGKALAYVPKEKRTSELCCIAIAQNGMALYDAPREHITPELYYIAVEQNGNALQYVPVKLRTPELCRLAVERYGMALYFVPNEVKTPEFLALIPPMQPKWSPDILKGLYPQPQSSYEDIRAIAV
jgi:Domain of unknown function (DUF4116)